MSYVCCDYDSCILRAWLKAVLAGSKLGQLSKTFSLIPDNECLEVSLIVSQFSLGQKWTEIRNIFICAHKQGIGLQCSRLTGFYVNSLCSADQMVFSLCQCVLRFHKKGQHLQLVQMPMCLNISFRQQLNYLNLKKKKKRNITNKLTFSLWHHRSAWRTLSHACILFTCQLSNVCCWCRKHAHINWC